MRTLGKNAEVNDPAILRAELRGVREQRDLFADRLFRVRAEHGELRDALASLAMPAMPLDDDRRAAVLAILARIHG